MQDIFKYKEEFDWSEADETPQRNKTLGPGPDEEETGDSSDAQALDPKTVKSLLDKLLKNMAKVPDTLKLPDPGTLDEGSEPEEIPNTITNPDPFNHGTGPDEPFEGPFNPGDQAPVDSFGFDLG